MQAFGELDRLKDKLGLSDAIVEKAAYIYRKAKEKELIRGRIISSVLDATTCMACRVMGAPRSIRDMTEITNVKSTEIAHAYGLLILEMDLKVALIDPANYVVQIANKAKISEKTKRIATDTMEEIVKREISAGKNPIGLIAAVLYVSCLENNENMIKKDIAEAAGVTEATIRNRFKDVKACLCLNWGVVNRDANVDVKVQELWRSLLGDLCAEESTEDLKSIVTSSDTSHICSGGHKNEYLTSEYMDWS